MELRFVPIIFPGDRDRLIRFLTSEEWPFHVNHHLDSKKVEEMLQEGLFDGSNHESHWILDPSGAEVGFIRLFDLDDIDDGYPLFDLRVRVEHRGQGIGRFAVEWLTNYLFEKYPNLGRIVGTTRVDNEAMRKVFRSCFFAKEGHYRKDWSAANGKVFDTIKYGILREDWTSKKVTPVNWNDET
jgi:RimJ/RimL family protein N-acetyltransferase